MLLYTAGKLNDKYYNHINLNVRQKQHYIIKLLQHVLTNYFVISNYFIYKNISFSQNVKYLVIQIFYKQKIHTIILKKM